MLLKRLLLVTLLTISSAISAENVTAIINTTTTTTTITSTSTSEVPTIETFTLPTATINSTILPVIVVESADGDDVAADMDPVDTSEVKEVDLTTLEEEDSYPPNDTLVEANAGVDLAPKIVGLKSEEDGESNGFGITHELVFISDPENSTDSAETSTEANDYVKVFLKPDGVVLPTDSDYFINGTEKATTEPPPETFWDRAQNFVGWFSQKNPQWTILVLVVLFSLILLLLFLVFRECCKQRRRHRNPHSYHFTGGITDDLYNTTSLSHRYEKVTLPNQTEVTMQLVSADNSVV